MQAESASGVHSTSENRRFRITFPDIPDELGQDEEIFEYERDGHSNQLRIHDYAALYGVPGLYESLVYDKLQCRSPVRVASLINSVLADWPGSTKDLRVLDLGAGNGIVAEELQRIGVDHVVGLDLLPEARMAAQRDRPNAYKEYFVADLCDLSDQEKAGLSKHRFNCLATVAALGFGDIPPQAFANAFNFVSTDGWVAMTIKEDFLDSADDSGFSTLIREALDLNILDIQAHHRYCHRLSITGEQLFYIAIVGKKTRDIPHSLIAAIDEAAVIEPGQFGATELLLGRHQPV